MIKADSRSKRKALVTKMCWFIALWVFGVVATVIAVYPLKLLLTRALSH
ncbi:hypothetical protein AWB70_06042 [Caballeronia cordobensis]|uniref:DUF2474 domain-containing protein n=1 Tax=Caballeronia cordobensis TaxID=1353886 RepID=A0A158J945_CABCO|nr:hypothetical protein BRPE67_BCDS03650 [Burkholderia sp. RPE67]SAL64901.1 hypothetical protein AWB70_06042 [Caballeronia cordobensis]